MHYRYQIDIAHVSEVMPTTLTIKDRYTPSQGVVLEYIEEGVKNLEKYHPWRYLGRSIEGDRMSIVRASLLGPRDQPVPGSVRDYIVWRENDDGKLLISPHAYQIDRVIWCMSSEYGSPLSCGTYARNASYGITGYLGYCLAQENNGLVQGAEYIIYGQRPFRPETGVAYRIQYLGNARWQELDL